jgi:hypothetical protein
MKRICLFSLIVLFFAAGCAPMAAPTQAPSLQEIAEQPVAAATMAAPAQPPAQATRGPLATPAPGGPGSSDQLNYAPTGNTMVIKDAEMELLVADTERAISSVTQMAADNAGYIIDSQTWYTDGYKYASLKLGIPSLQFERALNILRDMAIRVVREKATGQDVSAAYVDLQSKETNLEATAARVRDFLKDAKTIEDSLRINQQLSDLEAQIEQVKGQMRFYEGRSAYSTVTVYLTPQYPTPTPTMTSTPVATQTPAPPWDPGRTFNKAAKVFTNGAQATTDLVIWLVVIFGPVAVAFYILFLIYKLLKRKARKDQ